MTVGRTCCHQLATWQHFFLYLSTHSTVGYSVRFCFFGILLWVFFAYMALEVSTPGLAQSLYPLDVVGRNEFI